MRVLLLMVGRCEAGVGAGEGVGVSYGGESFVAMLAEVVRRRCVVLGSSRWDYGNKCMAQHIKRISRCITYDMRNYPIRFALRNDMHIANTLSLTSCTRASLSAPTPLAREISASSEIEQMG